MLHRQRNQLFLERIALAIIGIDQEATAERNEVMYIWNRRPAHIRKLDDKALSRWTCRGHAAAARYIAEHVWSRAGLRVPTRRGIRTPKAGSLQSLAFRAVGL